MRLPAAFIIIKVAGAQAQVPKIFFELLFFILLNPILKIEADFILSVRKMFCRMLIAQYALKFC
jgi:hypothetical protein